MSECLKTILKVLPLFSLGLQHHQTFFMGTKIKQKGLLSGVFSDFQAHTSENSTEEGSEKVILISTKLDVYFFLT